MMPIAYPAATARGFNSGGYGIGGDIIEGVAAARRGPIDDNDGGLRDMRGHEDQTPILDFPPQGMAEEEEENSGSRIEPVAVESQQHQHQQHEEAGDLAAAVESLGGGEKIERVESSCHERSGDISDVGGVGDGSKSFIEEGGVLGAGDYPPGGGGDVFVVGPEKTPEKKDHAVMAMDIATTPVPPDTISSATETSTTLLPPPAVLLSTEGEKEAATALDGLPSPSPPSGKQDGTEMAAMAAPGVATILGETPVEVTVALTATGVSSDSAPAIAAAATTSFSASSTSMLVPSQPTSAAVVSSPPLGTPIGVAAMNGPTLAPPLFSSPLKQSGRAVSAVVPGAAVMAAETAPAAVSTSSVLGAAFTPSGEAPASDMTSAAATAAAATAAAAAAESSKVAALWQQQTSSPPRNSNGSPTLAVANGRLITATGRIGGIFSTATATATAPSSIKSRKLRWPLNRAGNGSGKTGSANGDAASSDSAAPIVPRIKDPRPELLGAVVARVSVRRGSADEDDEDDDDDDGGVAGSGDDDGVDGDEDGGGGGFAMAESDDDDEGEGEGDGEGGESLHAGDKKRRRKKKVEEAPVVREFVVSTFDEIEGKYILVNAHGEEARMNLEELEGAMRQSQVWRGGGGGAAVFLVGSSVLYNT